MWDLQKLAEFFSWPPHRHSQHDEDSNSSPQTSSPLQTTAQAQGYRGSPTHSASLQPDSPALSTPSIGSPAKSKPGYQLQVHMILR